MKDRQLLIFTSLEPETAFLIRNMKQIFDKELDFISCTKEDLLAGRIPDPQAVLVSTQEDLETARKYFHRQRIIKVERMLTCGNIENIISLPEGKELVVVNYPQDCAIETVNSLYAMGVNHLKLIPYWLGCGLDLSIYDTAVYPGFREYVPQEFDHYIDIGYRHISFATLFAIIQEFSLSSHYIRDIYEETISTFVEKNYALSRFLDRAKTMARNFRWICDMSKDGILCIDAEDFLTICNPVAERLLSIRPSEETDFNYREVLSAVPQLCEMAVQRKELADVLITVNGEKAMVSTYKIDIEGKNNYLLKLSLVETIQQTEIQVRKKLTQKGFYAKYCFQDIKGRSQIVRDVRVLAERYAKSDLTVLISGRSGTGKELFAQAIHNASERKQAPFVAINFAALPETLAESELFGYEEGAFTGASRGGKAGLFEMAHNGTLFLDEIGDASLSVQARLLRVLEEREVMRIGSSKYIPIDVRVICATNKDLPQMVAQGLFRNDLLYRIDVLPLRIPDLRERREDILPIFEHISSAYDIRRDFSQDILSLFEDYDWPGNIRELKSAIQYLSVIGRDETVCSDDEFGKFVRAYFQTKHLESAATEETLPFKGSIEFFILSEISRSNDANRRIGRNSLLSRAVQQGLPLTEAKLKNALTRLRENGLISQGKTKQGAQLTPAGKEFLQRQKA